VTPTPIPGRPCAGDRDQVIETLRHGWEDEQLSLDTFGQRVEAAYTARSYAQLEGLVADLPGRTRAERAICSIVGYVSRFTAHIESAWHEPRTARLALPAEGTVVLGRARDCDCVVSDDTVSRRHACLRCGDGAWYIRDLQSANGTRINGWRVVDEVQVKPGDRVSFGAVAYRLGPPQ
jgi:hypothetical protein